MHVSTDQLEKFFVVVLLLPLLGSIFKDHLNEFQAKINKPSPKTTGCKLYNTVIQSVSTKLALKCNSKVLASLHCRSEVLHNQALNFSKNSFNEQIIGF